MSRLPLRLAALIVFFFSFLLFLSGWILQQRSLSAMQEALKPRLGKHKTSPPKSSKSEFQLLDQTDGINSRPFSKGAGSKKEKVAYVQFVTEKNKLCNSVMVLAELHKLGTVADKVLLYPHSWVGDEKGTWSRLLRVAEQRYGVVVKAVDPLIEAGNIPAISLLHLFAETKYSRVLYLDSSGMVLRNFDELLFNAPASPVAGVRAYWRSREQQAEAPLSDHLLLIKPSKEELERVTNALNQNTDISPMRLINQLYSSHALILPQHPYDTLISEFRTDEHERYILGGKDNWNPTKIREESYYVNFEDEDTPMPWYILLRETEEKVRPKRPDDGRIWKGLYNRWARQRMDVCGLDLEPFPGDFDEM